MPFDLQTTEGGALDTSPEALEEARAWDVVVARWADEAAHRAYLARFADLDGLARAGKRYRAALAQRPGDAVAQRWRDEIVKRATVQGLASLPRTPPRPPMSGWVKVALLSASASLLGWAAWWALQLFGRMPHP